MANSYRCEAQLEHPDGRVFTLALSNNAKCELEKILGINGSEEWNRRFGDEGWKEIRAQLFIMLQKFHKRHVPTQEVAGNLIDEIGDFRVRKVLNEIWRLHGENMRAVIEEELKAAGEELPKENSPGSNIETTP